MGGPAVGPIVRLAVATVVPAVPDLDLHDDVPLGGHLQEIAEPGPVGIVEPVQVVQPVLRIAVERVEIVVVVDIAALVGSVAAGHRIAHVVAADGDQPIQMGFQAIGPDIRVIEQVVLIAAAQQQNRMPFVLPVGGIPGIRPDAVRVISQRGTAPHNRTANQAMIPARRFPDFATTILPNSFGSYGWLPGFAGCTRLFF
jgi:hypothetical protein